MLRILRAFAWMRWRVLVNSLERTGARDTLQRLSLAVEQLGPLLAAALFVPSAVGLAGLSGYAGYALGTSPERSSMFFDVLRYLLLATVALSIAGPIMLPATERTNAVRLLLLPIPRPVLYVAQTASALADPWILLVVPIVVSFPLGLAAAGSPLPALVALAAGVLLLVVLLGLSSLTSIVMHLVLRDRRRGELLALAFIVVLPVIGMLPGLMDADDKRDRHQRDVELREDPIPSWVQETGRRGFTLIPSELFRTSVSQSVQGNRLAAVPPLVMLAAVATTLHGFGLLASARMLASPSSTGRTRVGSSASRGFTVPGVSAGASAVAINQVRLAIRTPRGRSSLLSPLLVFAVFLLFMRRSGGMDLGFIELESGLGLATFGAAVCLLAILPFAMNQFAVDGAGLTMQFLSPLSDLDILIGKAVGNGLVATVPALLSVVLAAVVFPGGSAAMWLSIPVAMLAIYVAAAPAAAVFSAIFPRAVDLNSIGSRSNAHGLAGLFGMLTFVVAAGPPALLVGLATMLGRPAAAPVLLLIWCAFALVVSRLLLGVVSRLLHQRRENLALVV